MIVARTALMVLASFVSLVGQSDGKRPPPKPTTPEWPKLTAAQTERAITLVGHLRRDEPELQANAKKELTGLGAGLAPLLLRRLTDDETERNPALIEILDTITTPEHAPLLARAAKDQKVAVRGYVVERLAKHRLPESTPIFVAALKDESDDVAFRAALGLLALRDFRAFDVVAKRATDDWNGNVTVIASVLTGVGDESTAVETLARITKADTRGAAGRLRLFRYLGTKESAGALKLRLDVEDFGVKKETINALRALVDGAPPLENLSVFQAIEVAKEWKARI